MHQKNWAVREQDWVWRRSSSSFIAMKKGGTNRFAMNFRKAGSQETYAPGSSSLAPPGSTAGPPGATAAPPAKKKSRFAAAAAPNAAQPSTEGRCARAEGLAGVAVLVCNRDSMGMHAQEKDGAHRHIQTVSGTGQYQPLQ